MLQLNITYKLNWLSVDIYSENNDIYQFKTDKVRIILYIFIRIKKNRLIFCYARIYKKKKLPDL